MTFNKVESSTFIERRKSVPGGCWKVPPHKSYLVISQFVLLTLMHWVVIYPLDSDFIRWIALHHKMLHFAQQATDKMTTESYF